METIITILTNAWSVLVFPGLLFAVVVGLLLAGIDRKILARMQKRKGPPILQPTYDFFKLMGKETIIPHAANRKAFLIAPVLGFVSLVVLTLWNPVLWLVLFAIVLIAVCIVILTGDKTRGRVLAKTEADSEDGKYATFFGGEQSAHSHVAGSDLFWGFKHDFKGYFKFIQGMHSGVVNDYALYAVVGAALITVLMFVFVH